MYTTKCNEDTDTNETHKTTSFIYEIDMESDEDNPMEEIV